MSHIRTIKPEFFFDEHLAELNESDQLFFIGLWCQSDKEGRLEDRPQMLRAQIRPYDAKYNAEATLSRLHPRFIFRYEADGKKYIQINNFKKHQKPHHTEKDSVIPAPVRRINEVTEPVANGDSPLGHGELTPKNNSLEEGRERKGREGSASSGEPEEVPAPLAELLLKLKKITLQEPGELWRSWVQAYPDVDIPREILKAEAWAVGKNVTRSPKGWAKTLNSWLSREQDKAKGKPQTNEVRREVVI